MENQIICDCGEAVDAFPFSDTLECVCGALYNPFGQRVTMSLRELAMLDASEWMDW